MRFSLKWILFGMAYVALAAAALTQDHWAYADLLWLATFLAICWAIVTAIFSNGSRRAAAMGFALFAVGFASCAQFAYQSIPTRRILLSVGMPEYPVYQPAPAVYSSPQPPFTAAYSVPAINSYPLPAPLAPATPSPPPTQAPMPVPVIAFASPVELPFISKVRALNSLISVLLGLSGAWLAAAAYRSHCSATASSDG